MTFTNEFNDRLQLFIIHLATCGGECTELTISDNIYFKIVRELVYQEIEMNPPDYVPDFGDFLVFNTPTGKIIINRAGAK